MDKDKETTLKDLNCGDIFRYKRELGLRKPRHYVAGYWNTKQKREVTRLLDGYTRLTMRIDEEVVVCQNPKIISQDSEEHLGIHDGTVVL